MAGKMCPKIIIEGTRLTFKTEVAFALNEHQRIVGPRKYAYHSPIISGEWCAFTNFPWGRGMINYQPEEEDMALETYQTWVRLLELQKYYSWIIDRWHISTQMVQRMQYQNEVDFSWLEERLGKIGFVLVYLHRSAESFESARTRRLKVSGNPSQYDDLEIFIREQEIVKQLVEASSLPVLSIDVSNNDIPGVVDEIADYLHDSGKIYADY